MADNTPPSPGRRLAPTARAPQGTAPSVRRPAGNGSNPYDDAAQRIVQGSTADQLRKVAHDEGTLGEFIDSPARPDAYEGVDPLSLFPRPGAQGGDDQGGEGT